jgi:ribonuclease P/MRP protein subunit POP8
MSNEKEPGISPDVDMTDVESSTALKRKRSEKTSSTVTQFTIRNPPWSYLQLSLITNSPDYQLDALTAHLHLRAALSQFLGLHGTAIPIDILKLHGNNVHVRVPSEDASAVVIAVGGWVGKAGEGWRVRSSGSWGAGLHSSTAGTDLFK